MPAWMPGFYRILDYEKNVSNFRASDGQGRALPWEKATRNTWRVATGSAPAVVLDYDVFGDDPVRGPELPGREAGLHRAAGPLHVRLRAARIIP